MGTPDERQAQQAAQAAASVAGVQGEGDAAGGLVKPAVDRWMAASKVVAEITQEDHLVFTGEAPRRGWQPCVNRRLRMSRRW